MHFNLEETIKEDIRLNLAKRNAENKAERRLARELIKFDIGRLRWWRKLNRGW